MAGQYETLLCPFCGKGQIQCLYFPGAIQERRHSTATFGHETRRSKSSDAWIVQSGCSVCGKSDEEVEKKLKEDGII